MTLITRLPKNDAGRDFAVFDVHGHFDRLEQLLARVGFDCKRDRLILGGDLVDRGPDSDQVLDWLARPGRYAFMGNHELMTIAHACGTKEDADEHIVNGGGWMATMPDDVKLEYAQAFAALPLAIEVQTAAGLVGLVHADIEPGVSWQALVAELESGSRDSANWLLWSRERINRLAQGIRTPDVDGVSRVYVGHTPVKTPMLAGNVAFVDTGACFGGQMILIDIGTGQIAAIEEA